MLCAATVRKMPTSRMEAAPGNNGVGQRDAAVERGGAAQNAVVADHRHVNRSAAGKADDERNDPLWGKKTFVSRSPAPTSTVS